MASNVATEPPAPTPKNSVRSLLNKRLRLVKYTAFGAFYKCRVQDYEKGNPGQFVQSYNFHSIEENWKSLSSEAKEEYRELMRLENALVDQEKREIDKEIIALRPGPRAYTGYTTSRRVSQKDGDEDVDDIAYNPIAHYHQNMIAKLIGTPHQRIWANNIQAHLAEAYRNWPSLPENEKKRYIHRAKMEYRNFNNRCSLGDGYVDQVLARVLEKHEANASQLGLLTDYLSDDQIDDYEMDVEEH